MIGRADRGLLGRVAEWCGPLVDRASVSGGDIEAALEIASATGDAFGRPDVDTTVRWATLAALARANVTVARVTEAHTDALAILSEAGADATVHRRGRTWGVFAAEGGADPVQAVRHADHVVLKGHKPWCSLGGRLDAALVTARCDDRRGLFAVDLHDSGVRPRPAAGWVSRGLPDVVSVGIDFADVPAVPVGEAGWYLARPGFAWGGMGVAACWYGAAVGVADMLGTTRAKPDDAVLAMHRGRVDAALHAADCVLRDAATAVDDGAADGADGARSALRVRAVVAAVVESVIREVGHATGPAPLAFDEAHAARVADLTVYVRQHHGERDLATLGSA